MNSLNLLKTVVVFSLAFYSQSFACADGEIIGVKTGKCIKASGNCGTGCSYTLDEQGNLNITGDGTGIIGPSAFSGNKDIKNVNISGIKSANGYPTTFYGAGAGGGKITINEPMELFDAWEGNFSTIEINSSKFVPNYRAFYSNAIQNIIISDNIIKNFGSLAFTDSGGGGAAFNVDIQCKGNVEKCATIVAPAKAKLIKNGGTLDIDYWEGYDENGNWNEWSDKGLTVYDKNKKPLAFFGFDRKLISSYFYNPDGSIEIYDANGKLTGLKNAREITPAQAAELVKPGKNNTVTLTFK